MPSVAHWHCRQRRLPHAATHLLTAYLSKCPSRQGEKKRRKIGGLERGGIRHLQGRLRQRHWEQSSFEQCQVRHTILLRIAALRREHACGWPACPPWAVSGNTLSASPAVDTLGFKTWHGGCDHDFMPSSCGYAHPYGCACACISRTAPTPK